MRTMLSSPLQSLLMRKRKTRSFPQRSRSLSIHNVTSVNIQIAFLGKISFLDQKNTAKKISFEHNCSTINTRPWDAERPTRRTKSFSLSRTYHADLVSSWLRIVFTHLTIHPSTTLCCEPSLSATMSWPLKYDPASQSISFGGRDKALYPNSLVPFDQAVLASGDICRTYSDRDSSRRSMPENELFGIADEVDNKKAEGTSPGEDRCAFDTPLHNTTSISYPETNQLEETKQRRFVESLARGKWNRYRRQYTSKTSYEAHKSTNSLSTNDRVSTFYHFPPYVPYLTLSDGPCATLNNQSPRDLGLEDRTIGRGEWSSVSLSPIPTAIYHTMEKDLVIVTINHDTSEAKPSTPTERHCSPQSRMEKKQVPIRAYACPRQARFVFGHQNKRTSRELSGSHKESFLRKLLHPHENIIKPALQLATEVFCLKQDKMQQNEKQPLDVDSAEQVLSYGDVKEWRAERLWTVV